MACCNAGCRRWEAALPHRPGIALLPNLEPSTAESVCRLIQHFRQPEDLVVVSIHWGGNWPDQVSEPMQAFANQLVRRAGVDLIHGHSSHWPMKVEQIDDSLVMYGCGDVFNDYEGRSDFLSRRGELGILTVVDFDLQSLKLANWHHIGIHRQGFCLKMSDQLDGNFLDARVMGRLSI